MSTTTLNLDEFKTFIGRTQVATDVIHPGPANLLRLTFNRPEPEYREGDALPPAWLACYFLPRVAADALRPDGSPHDTGGVTRVPSTSATTLVVMPSVISPRSFHRITSSASDERNRSYISRCVVL